MGIYFNENTKSEIEILNEVYFGQTKEINESFKIFQELRKPYVSDKFLKYAAPKLNADPNLIKFNRSIEKAFGFNPFALMFDINPIPNAFTISMYHRVGFDMKDVKNNLIVTSSGYKYKPSAEYGTFVVITSQLFCDSNFTDREIFSVLLHEIGHNFQHAINNPIANLNMISKVCTFIDLAIDAATNPLNALGQAIGLAFISNKNFWNLVIKNGPAAWPKDPLTATYLGYIFLITNTSLTLFRDIRGIINNYNLISPEYVHIVLNKLKDSLIDVFGHPTKYADRVGSYLGEKTADSFAVMYGFGPDIASALLKLDTVKSASLMGVTKSIPIIGHAYNLITLPLVLIMELTDEHPRNHERILEMVDYLDKEFDMCQDPRMRPLIKKDMDNIKSSVKNISKNTSIIDPASIYTFITNTGFALNLRSFKDLLTTKFINTHDTINKSTVKLI